MRSTYYHDRGSLGRSATGTAQAAAANCHRGASWTHVQTVRQTDRQTDRHAERQRDRETDRQAERQTDRQQTDRETERHRDRETDRQADRQTRETERQTYRETDSETERQTDRHTYRQTGRQTGRQTDCSFLTCTAQPKNLTMSRTLGKMERVGILRTKNTQIWKTAAHAEYTLAAYIAAVHIIATQALPQCGSRIAPSGRTTGVTPDFSRNAVSVLYGLLRMIDMAHRMVIPGCSNSSHSSSPLTSTNCPTAKSAC